MTDRELDRVRAAYPPLLEEAPPEATVRRLRSEYSADGPGRRRGPSRRMALIGIGGVIVSGTAVAATTGSWNPVLGSSDRGAPPRAAKASVPADQLAALGILRRPQTDADRGPLVRSALKLLDRHTVNGVHTDAIRVLFRAPRELAVLVPVERYGPTDTKNAAVQRDGLCLMSTSKREARNVTVTRDGKPTKVRIPAGFAGWGLTCAGTDRLRTTGIQTGTSPDRSGGLIINGRPEHLANRRVTLVPDGVAHVKVRLRGGRSVSVPVRDNVYRYTVDGASANLGSTWFDAAGRRIDHRKP